jgi:DNA-binding MarR family transcriptional regulator
MSPLPAPNPLESHLGYWMRFVSNHVSGSFREKAEARGVTVAEWVALRTLFHLGDAGLGEVAAAMGADPGAASRLVDRLAKKGLARRERGKADRRAVSIALTAEGRDLVPRVARDADRNDAAFFGSLSGRDRAHLRRILAALVDLNGLTAKPLE